MTKQKVCSSVSSSKESVQTRINTWSQKYIGCVIVDVYAYVFYTDSKSDMQSKIVYPVKTPLFWSRSFLWNLSTYVFCFAHVVLLADFFIKKLALL